MANGNIDRLNFEVILDDKLFNEQIKKDLKAANDLNKQLSSILNMKKRLNKETTQQIVNAEKVRQAEQKTAQEMAKTALAQEKVRTQAEKTAVAQRMNTSAVMQTNSALLSTTSIMRTLSMLTGVTFSVIGIRRFLSSMIEITGQFEVQKMALRTLLQDVSAADRIFRQLYEFSNESTYRFSELAKYAKQLSGFQIGKDDLLETTKMLGDVASGLGVSMDRLILAYGHVKSSGFLRGIQLRSFSQNGVPILKELSDMFTEIEGKAVSMGDVFTKMTKREISFDMVEEAFRRMTGEGGQFYKMQETLAKTLAGQINILKGKWENALYGIGQANDGILKGGVKALRFIVEHLQEIGRILKPVVAGFGMYYSVLLLCAGAQKLLALTTFISEFVTLTRNVGLATAAMAAFGSITTAVAATMGVLAAVGVAIYGIVKGTTAAAKSMADFRKELDEIHESALNNNAISEEAVEIDSLRKILNDTNRSYDERKAALERLKTIVPEYHAELTEEGRLIKNNVSALDDYVNALNRAAKMKANREELEELYKKRNEIERLKEEAEEAVKANAGAAYVQGGLSVTGYAFVPALDSEAKRKRDLELVSQKLTEIDRQIESVNNSIAEGLVGAVPEGPDSYHVDEIIKLIKDYDAKIENLRKKAKAGPISADEKKEITELLEFRKEQADLYEEIMGIQYDKDNKVGGGSKKADPLEAARTRLKNEISLLEKYRDARGKLEPIFGEDTPSILESIFGKVTDFTKIDTSIEELIAKLRKLGEKGKEAAEQIEARLGLDAVSKMVKQSQEAEKALKALEKYETTVRKWAGEDFNIKGTGFEYDISKAFAEYNTKISAVEEKYLAALKEAQEAHKGNAEAIAAEAAKLRALADAEEEYVRVQAQEKINNLAESYLKDQYFMRGISMDHLGDMTFGQLRNLRNEMKEIEADVNRMGIGISTAEGYLASLGLSIETLTEEDLELLKDKLPEAAIETIKFAKSMKDSGLSLDELIAKIKEALKKGFKNLDEQDIKNLTKLAKFAANQILELAGAMRELGEATDNANLVTTAESIETIGDIAKNVAQGFSQGGPFGMVLAMLSSVGTRVLNDLTEQEKEAAEAAEKMAEAMRKYNAEMDKAAVASQSSIFGTNQLGKVRAYLEQLKKYKKYIDEIFSFDLSNDADREVWAIWNAYGAVDENGVPNLDIIKSLIESGTWSGETAKDMEAAIERYKEAIEAVADAEEAVFGDMADSITDVVVDSWWEAGKAALDYEDILEDVAKTYAKLFVKDALMKGVFNEKRVKALSEAFEAEDADKAMAVVSEAMESAKNMLPTIEAALQAFEPYRNIGGGDESNSVGGGIKSITEDTANLRASYINAMRADVSYMRVMQEKGWADVASIAGVVASPTLNDYIAQIAATNFDIAQSNQAILSEIRSVIGAPGTSGMVVRVESY